jgi:hypothetical protein
VVANGGFVPESPETAYQPVPVAMPAPIVVPLQAVAQSAPPYIPPQAAPPAPAMAPMAPVASATPVADAGLIRDTFLRPRPRTDDNA